MRKLSGLEEKRLAALTAKSVETCLIEPTLTGLKKSILDATMPVSRHLLEMNIHDYANQGQGPDHKITIKSVLLKEGSSVETKVSMYRPTTKKGDPRIWFSGLPNFCNANDILSLIIYDEQIYVINLTQTPVEEILTTRKRGPIWDFLNNINVNATVVSNELYEKIKKIALTGPVRAVNEMRADTSIGRTLETLLGIEINSRQAPDYKGIELKSYRKKRKGSETRKNLFAKVPNWRLSKFKSSSEILKHFGYSRAEQFKLYCTVKTTITNSQGLRLKIDQKSDHLIEFSDQREIDEFAVWAMEDLRKKLLEKHNETFWVAAQSLDIDNHEHFQFTEIMHTRRPIISQFDILVEQGAISVDHLIKRTKTGGASEKGPLFKIDTPSLEMLFPPSRVYTLI